MDKQHKEFFRLTDEIMDLLANPHNLVLREALLSLLVEFARYSLDHMDYEENLIIKFHCKGCEDHPASHDYFREKMTGYMRQVRNNESNIYKLAQEIATFAQDWMTNHILRKDRNYIWCISEPATNR